MISFGRVGISGAGIIISLMWLMVSVFNLNYLLSATGTIELSILWPFFLNNRFTFKDKIRSAHLLLGPSVHKGWGLVVTEANSMGTTVIAYDISLLRDSVIDRKVGDLVNKNSSANLVQATISLQSDKDLLRIY
jgi:putative flippase GtrA